MRTVHFRSLLIGAVAVVTFAGSVASQDKPSVLLNSLELQQLVKRAEPGGNARLAAHFTALADRYAAEAKRHTSMVQSSVGNPSRNLGTVMSAHGKQPADLNTKPANELRELAAYQSTPAEHRALEEYLLTLAKRYTADATEHATTANTYRGTRIAQAAVHCDNLVRLSRDAAKEATATAEMPQAACRHRPVWVAVSVRAGAFRWPGGNRITDTVTS